MRSFLRPVFRPITPLFRTQSFLPRQATLLSPHAGNVARTFRTSPTLLKRKGKKGEAKKDKRIIKIRYFLRHPKTPRPLRFSRLRSLRHWTIHRAWMLYTMKRRKATELSMERQYNSMRDACESLRLMNENGMTVTEDEAAQAGKSIGRLYRVAMEKKRVWGMQGGFPIEYARAQTDFPSKAGWDHGWTR